jgi:release factor glutamine methyltransferase
MSLMLTVQSAYRSLRAALSPMYGDREAAQISAMVMEQLTGFTRSEMLVRDHQALDANQLAQFDRWQEELLAWRPVQYVLGEAWFSGMRFRVDERVLIPRPETEELVEWIIQKWKLEGGRWKVGEEQAADVLDIGTGSGCIAIALKKRLPDAVVIAIDKSTGALQLARENAAALDADLHVHEIDILDDFQTASLPRVQVIVSNPPYVPRSAGKHMRPNVHRYEPHLALFVSDEDPLLFYRVIAVRGLQLLAPGGMLFFEIHVGAGQAVAELLLQLGYTGVERKEDLSGLERMVAGIRP